MNTFEPPTMAANGGVQVLEAIMTSKKRLTMSQIGQLAGTSRSTVSRVLTNSPKVSDETRKRVKEVIREHKFRPNLFARGLRGARTGQIAVIGEWMGRGFVADVIQGVDAAAREHDAHLLACFAHSTDDYVALWRRFARSGEADGTVLIAPPSEVLGHPVEPGDAPVVLCACEGSRNRKGWRNVDSVSLDNRGAIAELMDHLLEQGCHDFVYVSAVGDNYDIRERRDAFEQYIAAHAGLSSQVIEMRALYRETKAQVVELLQSRATAPDAFVCFNDDMALGTLDALKDRGLSIPREVAVTGFDNVTYTQLAGLTSMDVPGIKMGEEAVHLLFRRLNEHEDETVARNTVIRPVPRYRASTCIRASAPPTPGS